MMRTLAPRTTPAFLLAAAATAAMAFAPAAAAAQAAAQVAAAAQDTRAMRVDSILAATYQADGPGAAVAVVQDGRIVLERAYGRAHLEHDVPITPATIFHVASVSKQFATFAVLLLEQQGKLSLDDDIRKHLPELHDFGHRITIRHLANHTSGIRDQWELLMMAGWRIDDVITRDQVMAMMRRQRELNFQPGSEYLYSNMGYSLLAEIVERASGRPFPQFLHDELFLPLGMHGTHVHHDHEMVVPGRAYSYRPAAGQGGAQPTAQGGTTDGQAGVRWRNAVLSYANQGATSLFTTTGDLARWLVNFETGQVGGAQAIAAMRTRAVLTSGDTIPYALGVQRGQHRGLVHWGHGGSDAGFRAQVMHFPGERLGIVVVSNSATTNAGALATAIADVFLDARTVAVNAAQQQAVPTSAQQQPQPQPQPQQQPQPQPPGQPQWQPEPASLRAFAGTYFSPELATAYTVELRDGALVATHQRLSDMSMAPGAAADAFRMGSRQARFERDHAGAITGFRLSGGRVRNVLFIRLPDGALPAW
jgi:CubicO group peptidase (beta-lactamase class C family)